MMLQRRYCKPPWSRFSEDNQEEAHQLMIDAEKNFSCSRKFPRNNWHFAQSRLKM